MTAENKDELCASELDELVPLSEDLERSLRERGLPAASRSYSDRQKERFLGDFTNRLRISRANETELMLCRGFVAELLEKGSEAALSVRGYSAFGGNRLFPCDWEMSRKCLTELYEKTDDPLCLSSLGCIYYYGRCSGGKPDYERAYQAFSVAAAGGLHEGMYRLGDLFRYGHGCRKSELTARNLYCMVYDDCREQLTEGENDDFAAAAKRMGDVYLYGIHEEKSPELAFIYYTQAEYALRRMELEEGSDEELGEELHTAMTEAESLLPEEDFLGYQPYLWPEPFRALVSEGYRAELTMEQGRDGTCLFRAARLPYPGRMKAKPILVSLPLARSCILASTLTMECENAEACFVSETQGSIRFDLCCWFPSEHATEFYYDGRRVGRIYADQFRLYP